MFSNMLKSVPLLFSLWSPGAPRLPGAPSSATLSDKWGRPHVQGSNMLFQDPKRKKSPSQLHIIWWQTPFPDPETTAMHEKVPGSIAKHCKNTFFKQHGKRESFQSCSRVCLFFAHSEVQVPQGYPAPQVRPPLAIREADPTCKGLDDRPPSLKETTTMHEKVPGSIAKHCKNTFFKQHIRKEKVFKHVQECASSFLILKSRCPKVTRRPKFGHPGR